MQEDSDSNDYEMMINLYENPHKREAVDEAQQNPSSPLKPPEEPQELQLPYSSEPLLRRPNIAPENENGHQELD